MSKPKHTPGPWSVETQFKILTNMNEEQIRLPYYEVGNDLRTLAKLDTGMNDKANARLIAAAPELLEALAWVKGHVDRCTAKDSTTDEYGLGKIKVPYGTGTVVDAKLILDKITAAIAKAEGRES